MLPDFRMTLKTYRLMCMCLCLLQETYMFCGYMPFVTYYSFILLLCVCVRDRGFSFFPLLLFCICFPCWCHL
ncbi:hypothetical protein TRSC58_07595 [Trypanosoma rangeli SC58]|uniref:Uncharacterized protein n=1 Tax=Trypanosoma rangeli SC58 TaxID=429131 RepID=A0A061ISJ4_TRYRA|nr:hypothetical protein TRSC58_07595 [Trypanosoma rangeli SC58]